MKRHLFNLLILVVVLVVLGVLNIYIFVKREAGYLYKHTDYNVLYYPQEIPVITGFEFLKNKKLKLKITPQQQSQNWSVAVDNGSGENTQKRNNPSFTLINDFHVYTVESEDKKIKFSIEILFTPSKTYTDASHASPDNCEIKKASIPIVNFKRYPLNYLCYTKMIYPEQEIKRADGILKNEMGVKLSDSTQQRILKIASFLQNKFKDLKGIPDDAMKGMTPLEQYDNILAGKSGLWCSNYAMIYTFFATCADIPTRLVALKGKLDGVQLTGHIFSESFDFKQARWGKVDVTSNIFLVKNAKGQLLNTVDVLHLMLNQNPGNCVSVQNNENGNIVEVPYEKRLVLEECVFNNNTICVFYFPYLYHHSPYAKVSHYMLNPDLAYSCSSSNGKHYIKIIAFYGAIIIGLIILGYLIYLIIYFKKSNSSTRALLNSRTS